MNPENYFIKDGYRANTIAVTMDTISGTPFWTEARIQTSHCYQYPVYKYAAELTKKHRLRTIIDVGCGPATKLEMVHRAYPEAAIIGIDQADPIKYCQQKFDWGTWLVDDFSSPRPDLDCSPADLVISSDVIEHLEDPDVLLNYLRGLVKPGGFVLLSTPERDKLRGPNCMRSPKAEHIREWNQKEFAAFLTDRRFEVILQRLQLPVRFAPNKAFFREVAVRGLKGLPLRWNQLCLLRLA